MKQFNLIMTNCLAEYGSVCLDDMAKKELVPSVESHFIYVDFWTNCYCNERLAVATKIGLMLPYGDGFASDSADGD